MAGASAPPIEHTKLEANVKNTIALGLALVFGTLPAYSQATKKTEDAPPRNVEVPAQGWSVNCANGAQGLVCSATQSVRVGQSGQLLVATSVLKAAGPAPHSMSVILPHGLYLPAGASVQIDAEPIQALVVETCDQRGCYATMPITDKALAAMRTGKMLTVAFQNLSKNNMKVQLPLAGFPEAIKKL
jgi:invasion protein IalB